MPKNQLIDFVNKLKESGINVSFTKPRSHYVMKLVTVKQTPSMTIKS
ncbi:hypothetical protein HHO41_06510 [Bacillus sp. DNRA2]|nr:hypothetical protein [Bacillus sp. DNRA2]NMD69935.1 hypothetical protein [Bacillus sp. DNRA2]